MNIAVITQLYPEPDDVGDNKPTRTVEYFARAWVAAGHRVMVFHCSSRFPLALYLVPKAIKNRLGGQSSNIIPSLSSRKRLSRSDGGIEITRIPMFKLLPGNGYAKAKLKRTAGVIEKIAAQRQFVPELVVGHFANPSTALVAELAEHYRCKASIVFHNDCNATNVAKYDLATYAARIPAIGVRSRIEADKVRELLRLEMEPFICYSGVPDDVVERAQRECHKMDFSNGIKHLYVGSMIKRKHLDATLRAFAATREDGDTLLVVGGGPEESELRGLAHALDQTDAIRFTGRLSRDDTLERMKEAQVFTLISQGEAYGMVYMEAMLQGCLVVASKGEGFDGIITDGENGFLCRPGDDQMLASIYQRIRGLTEAERTRIGQNAIDTALHYSEREVAERYLSDVLARQKNERQEV